MKRAMLWMLLILLMPISFDTVVSLIMRIV